MTQGHEQQDAQLQAILRRLDALSDQVAYLNEGRRQSEALWAEAGPILREVMAVATVRLDELDRAGVFRFLRELGGVAQRVVEGYTAEDVRLLGAAIVTILNTVRAVTQPQVMEIVGEAAQVLQRADTAQPIGLIGMVRATRSEDVQKGMAVLMEVLRHVGQAAQALAQQTEPPAADQAMAKAASTAAKAEQPSVYDERRARLAATLGPRRTRSEPAAAHAKAPPPTPRPTKERAEVVLDGVAFGADGHLVDPAVWDRALAERVAAVMGIELTAERWRLIEFARSDFEKSGAAPNIRRITQGSGISTKEIYALFPKAPARTIARIAGTPKPAGCI